MGERSVEWPLLHSLSSVEIDAQEVQAALQAGALLSSEGWQQAAGTRLQGCRVVTCAAATHFHTCVSGKASLSQPS